MKPSDPDAPPRRPPLRGALEGATDAAGDLAELYDTCSGPVYRLALRLCLQYTDARLKEVRLDGHVLKRSPTDGYRVHHRQGTVVQVNIPPDQVHDLHIVTVRYDSNQRPIQGFTAQDWMHRNLRIDP